MCVPLTSFSVAYFDDNIMKQQFCSSQNYMYNCLVRDICVKSCLDILCHSDAKNHHSKTGGNKRRLKYEAFFMHSLVDVCKVLVSGKPRFGR